MIINGAGMVGLACAHLLAGAGFRVAVIEPNAPVFDWDSNSCSTRVSALNMASYRLLQHLGVWDKLSASAAVLERMVVWDTVGGGEISFDCSEVDAAQLGFIVENRVIVRALWQAAERDYSDNIKFYCPNRIENHAVLDNSVSIELDDQQVLLADLLIGADGALSWVRSVMGVDVNERSYQQLAVTAILETELAHGGCAWQPFLPTGPLGVLPMVDPHRVSIVWSAKTEEAERLLDLDGLAFGCECSNALNGRLGMMTLSSSRGSYPLVMRHAQDYAVARMVLVGDAAHTIHPLAGQGVNLGLLDAASLAEVLVDAREGGRDMGSLRVLKRYQRWRKAGNLTMIAAMRGFSDVFMQDASWLVQARSQGLMVSDRCGWLKRFFIHYAMADRGDLPAILRNLNF